MHLDCLAAPLANRPARLGFGVRAGRNPKGGVAQGPGQELAADGQVPGYGDFGAMEHHGVREPERWADQAQRQRRIYHHCLRPRKFGQFPHPVDQVGLGQQYRLPGRTMRNFCWRSHHSAPGCEAVKTVTSSAGKRRHSSQR